MRSKSKLNTAAFSSSIWRYLKLIASVVNSARGGIARRAVIMWQAGSAVYCQQEASAPNKAERTPPGEIRPAMAAALRFYIKNTPLTHSHRRRLRWVPSVRTVDQTLALSNAMLFIKNEWEWNYNFFSIQGLRKYFLQDAIIKPSGKMQFDFSFMYTKIGFEKIYRHFVLMQGKIDIFRLFFMDQFFRFLFWHVDMLLTLETRKWYLLTWLVKISASATKIMQHV